MAQMRAMEFTGPSEDLNLRLTTRPVPKPGDGERLIHICAAGVTLLKSFGIQPPAVGMVRRERTRSRRTSSQVFLRNWEPEYLAIGLETSCSE